MHRREPWHEACVLHDFAYWMGGSSADRLRADLTLYEAVRGCGYPVTAFFMFAAVRFFGSSFWPFSWRWGFGQE